MPIIGISVCQLNRLLGKSIPTEELSNLLECLGCDLDEIDEMILYQCPQCGVVNDKWKDEEPPKRCTICGYESINPFVEIERDQVIRLDLLPARPDLFDAGGLARAIKGYLNIQTSIPDYTAQSSGITVTVDPQLFHADSFRPYIACAIVTVPPVDSVLLRSLMKLQESLHWGIGRDRKLCAIGLDDMSTIKPPIRYTVVEPNGFRFHPLGKPDVLMTPAEILQKHPKGIAYGHLLAEHRKYPLLIDANDQVLSLPPIINSDETKVKVGSTRLFMDATGITKSDVQKSIKTLVASLVEFGGVVETLQIITYDMPAIHTTSTSKPINSQTTSGPADSQTTSGPADSQTTSGPADSQTTSGPADSQTTSGPKISASTHQANLRPLTMTTPDLTPGTIKVNLDSARHWLGIEFTNEEAIQHLKRMRFGVIGTGTELQVQYPAYRSDMKHEVDIFEDLAIAYGYTNIPTKLVPTMTVGKERPEEKIARLARDIMIGLGFSEIFSLMITTEDNHFKKLRLTPQNCALLLNPKAVEYNVVRSHLFTGLLEALQKNHTKPAPQQFFELGNVITLDAEKDTKSREERHVAFAIIGPNTGYAAGRSVVDALLYELGITATYQVSQYPMFIPGRSAQLQLSNHLSGYLGEVHPEVLNNFGLAYPVTMAEIGLIPVDIP